MPGVLSGIRVIDFGQYLAGPLVAQLLADQGADVIRVDPPGGPTWRTEANAILQRGKRSIVAALIARERSGGRGQRIEVSLFDAAYELVRFYGDRLPELVQSGALGLPRAAQVAS